MEDNSQPNRHSRSGGCEGLSKCLHSCAGQGLHRFTQQAAALFGYDFVGIIIHAALPDNAEGGHLGSG